MIRTNLYNIIVNHLKFGTCDVIIEITSIANIR